MRMLEHIFIVVVGTTLGLIIGKKVLIYLIEREILFHTASIIIMLCGVGMFILALYGDPKPGETEAGHFWGFTVFALLMGSFGAFMLYATLKQPKKKNRRKRIPKK